MGRENARQAYARMNDMYVCSIPRIECLQYLGFYKQFSEMGACAGCMNEVQNPKQTIPGSLLPQKSQGQGKASLEQVEVQILPQGQHWKGKNPSIGEQRPIYLMYFRRKPTLRKMLSKTEDLLSSAKLINCGISDANTSAYMGKGQIRSILSSREEKEIMPIEFTIDDQKAQTKVARFSGIKESTVQYGYGHDLQNNNPRYGEYVQDDYENGEVVDQGPQPQVWKEKQTYIIFTSDNNLKPQDVVEKVRDVVDCTVSSPSQIKKINRDHHRIQRLILCNFSPQNIPRTVEILFDLPALQELCLQKCFFNNQLLRKIWKLPLRKLEITNNPQIDHQGFVGMPESLSHLIIGWDDEFSELSDGRMRLVIDGLRLGAVKVLQISSEIGYETSRHLGQALPKLQKLWLKKAPTTDYALLLLTRIQSLQVLDISSYWPTAISQCVLSRFVHMREFRELVYGYKSRSFAVRNLGLGRRM